VNLLGNGRYRLVEISSSFSASIRSVDTLNSDRATHTLTALLDWCLMPSWVANSESSSLTWIAIDFLARALLISTVCGDSSSVLSLMAGALYWYLICLDVGVELICKIK
jgi:hypothetical protein